MCVRTGVIKERGGRSVRKLVQGLWLLALAVLLCLLTPGLIQEHTDQTTEAAEARPVRAVMLEAVGTVPAETTAAAVCRKTVDVQPRACVETRPQQPVIAVTCDGNGSPLGSAVWFHAVYQACPPEA